MTANLAFAGIMTGLLVASYYLGKAMDLASPLLRRLTLTAVAFETLLWALERAVRHYHVP